MAALKKNVGHVLKERIIPEFESVNQDISITPANNQISCPLSKDEERIILKLAKTVPKGHVCVCVGSGAAIACLTRGLKNKQGVIIYHIISPEINSAGWSGEEDAFIPAESTKTDIIQFETSEEASRKCREKVALVWINCSNSYEDLKKTLLAWQPKLALDAKVAFHGSNLPVPARIIKEYLGDQGDFTLLDSVSRTTVLSVDKCVHHWMIDSNEIGTCKYCGRKRNFKRIRSGIQGVENPKNEELPNSKKIVSQVDQPPLIKKKTTKRKRAWHTY